MFARIKKWLASSPDHELIGSLRRLNDELEGLNEHLCRVVPDPPRIRSEPNVEQQSWEQPSIEQWSDLELRTSGNDWGEDRGRMRVTVH